MQKLLLSALLSLTVWIPTTHAALYSFSSLSQQTQVGSSTGSASAAVPLAGASFVEVETIQQDASIGDPTLVETDAVPKSFVPEPGFYGLLGAGLGVIFLLQHRKRRAI